MAGQAIERDQERARRRQHVLEGENHVLKLIIEGNSLSAILSAIVEIAETQGSDGLLASVLLLDEDRIHLTHGAAPSIPAGYNDSINGLAIGPNAGSCGTAAYLRRQVIVSDIMTDPLWRDFRDLAQNYGLAACWSTPIFASNKSVLGTFALYYRQPRVPDADDQAVIEILTRTAALAIEHVRSEQRLAESEERFRSLSRCAPVGVFMTDSTGVFRYVNPRFVETGSFDYEKTLDYWLENATRQTDVVERARQALRARSEFAGEFVIGRDRSHRHVSLRMAPLRTNVGEYLGYVGTLEDISSRVSGEAALDKESSLRRATEDRLAIALDAGRMGTWEWDIRSGEITWSPQLELLHGLKPGTFAGTFEAFQADMIPEHRPRVLAAIQGALETKENYEVSYEIIRPDNSRGWLYSRGRVFCDKGGNPERMIGVCMDVPAQKASA